jgi:hypothetical protein
MRVTQKQLAAELALTDRRVRGLIKEGILPTADENGRYDAQHCRERYRLYQSRTDASAWMEFEDNLVQQARKAERLLNRALSPRSTEPQLRDASVTVQRLMSDMRFMVTCRSRSDAERDFVLEMWRDREDFALGALGARAADLLGAGTRRGRPSAA